MGLDMYLNKKIYIGNQYREEEEKIKVTLPKTQDKVLFPVGNIKQDRISSIIEEAGYWRKANHIHNWFVENVQEGEDNCGEYYVSTEKLQELLAICKKVLENHNLAQELLPTSSGFFFGCTEYDEWYFGSLENTINILEEALKDEDGDYYYTSSW